MIDLYLIIMLLSMILFYNMQEIKTIVELPKIIVIVIRGKNLNKSKFSFGLFLI